MTRIHPSGPSLVVSGSWIDSLFPSGKIRRQSRDHFYQPSDGLLWGRPEAIGATLRLTGRSHLLNANLFTIAFESLAYLPASQAESFE